MSKGQVGAKWVARTRGIVLPPAKIEIIETDSVQWKTLRAMEVERVKPLLYSPFTGMMHGSTRGAR